jgi:hypothetical protein
MKASHLKEYEEETKTPTGYTKPYNPSSLFDKNDPRFINALV